VDYADLAIIDLAKAGTAEGRAALAEQVTEAMAVHGFFYVINHGYTSEQVCVFSFLSLKRCSFLLSRQNVFSILPTSRLIMSATRRRKNMLAL
jgi:isopenicillin N synthase-like dioxygenase